MVLEHIKLVSPLHSAENIFLEVLLTEFSLQRQDNGGNKLTVSFDDKTPAIWSREAKYVIPKIMYNFQQNSQLIQQKLNSFFFDPNATSTYSHNNVNFPFRYASGGALAIVRYKNKEYYSLTYHEAFPVGWNIANGGCKNVNELLNPFDTIERELQMELILLNLNNNKRFVFKTDDKGKALYHPECAIANQFWADKLNNPQFAEIRIPLIWINGPDSLEIKYADEPARIIENCFININALDYGIEIDRIVKLNLDENTILCQGEIKRNELFNRPVGLFEVERLNKEMKNGSNEFIPDYVFHDAKRWDGSRLNGIMKNFIRLVSRIRPPEQMAEYDDSECKFGLCPAAKNIIKRYSLVPAGKAIKSQIYDAFVCFTTRDEDIAKAVYNYLEERKIKSFFSKENYSPNFLKAIDAALDVASSIVVIASEPEYLLRNWPSYEYESFLLRILSGRKPNTDGIIPFITGFTPDNLPPMLIKYSAVEFRSNDIFPALEKLHKIILDCKKKRVKNPAVPL